MHDSPHTERIREIPYNYTSFSDHEIVERFLGSETWEIVEKLRGSRRTGRSARMLFEVLGDMWVVTRNPFIQDDLLANSKRLQALIDALCHRLGQVEARADDNPLALELIAAAKQAVKRFSDWFPQQKRLRRRIQRELSRVTRSCNLDFSGFARVAHVTDASDWRVEYPCVVISVDSVDELPGIVTACARLGLTIIGRGGGTGYTGAAVPLVENTAVINMEKLDRVGAVEYKQLPGLEREVATVYAEAGAITRRVAEVAEEAGYVFAVDPTSMDSSTIGGNIAMNAGGKKAVVWGTTIDNLASWKMVTADGQWIEVQRLEHNLGKIHLQDKVRFRIRHFDAAGRLVDGADDLIEMPGSAFRKAGLGKDVTDKFLGGIPGIQKEGCDGLIASAEFILHRFPQHSHTLCLEFFNPDLRVATPAIVEIKDYLDRHPQVLLTGLEHLDERYLRAIGYSTKSARRSLPRMVLLMDLACDDVEILRHEVGAVLAMAAQRDAEGFVAESRDAQKQFWQDRSRTAAIAAHTNAFKINEDVVIPLERLAEYSQGIERINIEQSISNKIRIVAAVEDFLQQDLSQWLRQSDFDDSDESRKIVDAKCNSALELVAAVRRDWEALLDRLDVPVAGQQALLQRLQQYAADRGDEPDTQPEEGLSFIELLLRRSLVVSYRRAVEHPLKELFAGQSFDALRRRLDAVHAELRSSRLFVATHMHAGDGNVHTNIPVNSNDYAMLRAAEKVVDRVMQLATSLDGVISGEHGIGITKLQYLPEAYLQEFARYKRRVDPQQLFNRHKLSARGGLRRAYTPSLRLLQQEALILEASDLGALNDAIRHCLRCGKCKPECTTHIPRANLNYSPRNKILATSLLIEAFLYEEQTRRGISVRHFAEMNDVADHCTICHKCLAPCPVDIDFGEVTVLMRNALEKSRQKSKNIASRLSLAFLNARSPVAVRLLRLLLIRFGYSAQRMACRLLRPVLKNRQRIPEPTTGRTPVRRQLVHFVRKPLPADAPAKTLRVLLDIEDTKTVPIVRDPQRLNEQSPAVFYFPGCGSERLFSQIGLATLAMLYRQGVQTVLPPGYLCCGYPQSSAGQAGRGEAITTENRVLFHRVANTLNYLDIDTVIVSCGTCMDQLLTYEFDRIFPGCRLLDIHEYLFEQGVRLDGRQATEYLYHDPCHSPMKTYDPLTLTSALLGKEARLSPRCCGEAGTFGVSRPDIAAQARFRKQQELCSGIQRLTGAQRAADGGIKLLTACPSCQQGLAGYEPATGLKTEYIVVEMATRLLGDDWERQALAWFRNGGIEKVLL